MITLANGTQTTSKGIGEIEVICFNEFGQSQKVIMKEVLFVPDLDSCLLSVQKLTKRGVKVSFEKDHCYIYRRGKVVATGSRYKNLYKLNCKYERKIAARIKEVPDFPIHESIGVERSVSSIQSSEVEISVFCHYDNESTDQNELEEEEILGKNQNLEFMEDEAENEIDENDLNETIINVENKEINQRGDDSFEDEDAITDENINRRSERPNKGIPPIRLSTFNKVPQNRKIQKEKQAV